MHISDHQPIIMFTSEDLPLTRAKYFKQCLHNKHVFDQLDTNIHIPIQIIIMKSLNMRLKKNSF